MTRLRIALVICAAIALAPAQSPAPGWVRDVYPGARNTAYKLSQSPNPAFPVLVYINGLLMQEGPDYKLVKTQKLDGFVPYFIWQMVPTRPDWNSFQSPLVVQLIYQH